jgi:hypothetical protein
MAFSIFFFASSLCSAGDPVSPVPAALESPLVKSDGLIAMLSLESVQDVSASLQPRLHLRSVVYIIGVVEGERSRIFEVVMTEWSRTKTATMNGGGG